MNELNRLTIKEAADGLRKRKFSSLELTESCLKQIEKVERKIKAYITITEDEALRQAKEADRLLAHGKQKHKLLGIPVAVKDNFCTKGIRTTASAKILDDFIPPYNATVYRKLTAAGAVLLGKTNMDAWAHGSSTETSDYGPSYNPWNIERLPGGSSGGSAAAVAADETVAGIGSETAGSIRQPASWCGVVGLKPTYGRVSRFGVIAMGSSLDSPGPITKTVFDSALILSVISGYDPLDATSLDEPVMEYEKLLDSDIRRITIGYADDYLNSAEKQVSTSVIKTIKILEKAGAKIRKIKLFPPKYAIAVYTILQRGEVSSNLSRYDGIRYGNSRSKFGAEAKRRIMLGTYTLSAGYYDAYYLKAQKIRTLIIRDFEKAFKEVDIIIGPTSPTLPLKVGATKDQAMFGELADILVEPSAIAGLTAINIPADIVDALPVGVQLIGPQKQEVKVLQTAYSLEKLLDFNREIIL